MKRISRKLLLILAIGVVILIAVEAFFWIRFYFNVTSSRDSLVALKSELDLSTLSDSESHILEIRDKVNRTQGKLDSAASHVRRDPLLALATHLPVLNTQAVALKNLVEAGDAASHTASAASDVLLAFARQKNDPQANALEEGVNFLTSQHTAMDSVASGLNEMKLKRGAVHGHLIGPMQSAADDLDFAIARLQGLVDGYQRADALLPTVLGFNGPRRYLILPENDTELFPSGGLISNYGVATFNQGRIQDMQFEYFVALFDRWQKSSGGEYVAPPAPLKNYLLRDVSWGLGEAGWFPDFPQTSQLAQSFVYKGGTQQVDGTIAIDLQFVQALLKLLGPVTVQEYGITVKADDVSEKILEETRNDSAVPGAPGKSFLAPLANELIHRIFSAPKSQWVSLIRLLDQMAKERHLQLNFNDPQLQKVATEYGLDGSIVKPDGDFMLLADTSVRSTKLDLILKESAQMRVSLDTSGSASSRVAWQVMNPFPTWQQGRDPKLVKALMLDGIYGSYLRLYAPAGSQLNGIYLNGQSAGAEQIGPELGKMAFGRFFTVPPGQTSTIVFDYATPGVVKQLSTNTYIYDLYIQKEAGMAAPPLSVSFALPPGAVATSVQLDGKPVNGTTITTDLRTDRTVEIEFKTP